MYSKIRNDTFRTLTTDARFRKRVSENALIRVLNSFAWKQLLQHHSQLEEESHQQQQRQMHYQGNSGGSNTSSGTTTTTTTTTTGAGAVNDGANDGAANGLPPPVSLSNTAFFNQDFLYVQGMNVIAAPFLYTCKTEPQAYALFETFLARDCPLYIRPTLEGVHTGLMLIDRCLAIIDPVLYDSLRSKFLSAELYAFASVLTFSACTPPLAEVLVIWDFLFAYGPHLNILFVIAQLTLIRGQLLESKSPISLLRSFPPLRGKEIIKLGISFVALLPKGLYDLLKRHPYDESVHNILKQHTNSGAMGAAASSSASASASSSLQKPLRSSNEAKVSGSMRKRPT